MNDQEKIQGIERIVSRWALNDNASAVDALIEIMEVLDLDPYPREKGAAQGSTVGASGD